MIFTACGDDDGTDAGMDAAFDAPADSGADSAIDAPDVDGGVDSGEDAPAADVGLDTGPPARARLMYVSVGGDDRLAVVELGEDGAMTARSGMDLDLGAGPGAMAYAREARRLYVGAGGSLLTVSLDGSGAPSLEGTTTGVGNPVYIALAESETRLVTAYFGDNRLKLHDVSGGSPHAELDEATTDEEPHAALIGPGGLIYVPHRNGDVTQWWEIVDSDTLNMVGELDAASGVGPRHIIFSPDQTLAWLINEFDDSITSMAVAGDGALTAGDTISTLPEGADGSANTCADVHVTPNGQFVYGSNRGEDSLAMFNVGATGTLTSLGNVSTEERPREFDVSPDGRFVVAAGQDSGFLQSYAVEDDGTLTSIDRIDVGPGLRWVIID